MIDNCSNINFTESVKKYKYLLWFVIIINLVMFVFEIIAGHIAQSKALQADAVDFLADGVTYTVAIIVMGMSLYVRAFTALFKALLMICLSVWILGSSLYHHLIGVIPEHFIMGYVAIIALSVNVISVYALKPFSKGDANIRSVWLCTRNDAIGNISVIIAFIIGARLNVGWPDIVVAILMSGLYLSSSLSIIKQAVTEIASTK